jgi:hypothetical protein
MATPLRSTLVIGSTIATLFVGMGMAVAQIDNPPGATFQTEGQRESNGKTAVPSPYSRSAHQPEVPIPGRRSYAYGRRHIVIRHHRY